MAKLKVATLIEARVVTSPAGIALRFAAGARDLVDPVFIDFYRGARTPETGTEFQSAARALDFDIEMVEESGRFDPSRVRQLKGIFDRRKPEVVQTHSVKSHFLISRLRDRPFAWVAFHHGYTNEDFKMRLYNQLDRFSLKACDRVVTVCEAFARDLVKKGVPHKSIEVVPNAIAEDYLGADDIPAAPVRERFGVREGEAVVLAVGRLSPEKGLRYLIEAAGLLRRSAPELALKVLIAGDGPLKEELERTIAHAGLQNTVQLIGYQPDVKSLYRIADVFVLPSLSEGSPMVLFESMAARVPIVASYAGGIPEMLTDRESASLVPLADADALGRAIRELLGDSAYRGRVTGAAFRMIHDRYTPANYYQAILRICQNAWNEKKVRKNAA